MQCKQWSGLEKMKKNRRKKQTCGLAVLPVAVDGVAVADRGANWLVVRLSFSAFPFCFFSLLLCSSSCSLFYSFSPSLVLSNVPWSCCLQMKMKLRVISALIEQRFFLFFCYYFRFWFSFHLILICTLLLLRLWFLKWRRQWQRWFWSQRFPLHTFFPSTRFCLPLVLLPTFSLVLLAPPPCLLLFFFFLFFMSVSPLAFYSQRMHAFRDLLQEGCNGQSASWLRRISAVRHAPLIEAAPPLTSSLPFTVETVVDEEGNEQLSRKQYRFKIQNEYFWFDHWLFCNFVIKPSHKL